jgi:hypothetical protein
LLALIEYWREWPPASELLRGFVGYKPLSKEERKRREKATTQAVAREIGPAVAYDQLPKWLREAHTQQKQLPKPPSGG